MTMTQPIRTSVAGPTGVGRLFAAPAPDLASHLAAFGPMPAAFDEGHLIAELDDSGLTGRGGAGFPTWRKLIAAAESMPSKRGPAVVIANGAKGEPLSRKDATLLRSAPHLVLDGLLLAAATIRAGDVVLYATLEPVARAIVERLDAGRVRLVAP